MISQTQCMRCKYQLKDMTCKAFPNGIPHSLYFDKISHNQKLEGQTGDFIFEPTDYYSELESWAKNNYENSKNKPFQQKEKQKKEMVDYFFTEIKKQNYKKAWTKAIFYICWINNRKFKYPPIEVFINHEQNIMDNQLFRSIMRRKAKDLRYGKDCLYKTIKLTIFPNGSHQFELEKEKGSSRKEKMKKYKMELEKINTNVKKID